MVSRTQTVRNFASAVLIFGLVFSFDAHAREKWTELNIGPFYVDTDGDIAAARDALTQLEQVRWVLGGLLESKDLPSAWPIRVILTRSEKTNTKPEFISQHATYLFVASPGQDLPLGEVAGILLDSNTPRLPPEVESGLRELFATLRAKGSRVTWGGAPAHPDLAWARMQLLATRFEYSADFHIFLTTLKTGSTLQSAEQNAFGKNVVVLEKEAAANLSTGNWQPVAVSGRPLDPKRDFGEHSLDNAIASIYLADTVLASKPKQAEAAYKSGIEAGGAAKALGFAGLAAIAMDEKQDPKPFLEDAIHAGDKSAPIYVSASENLSADKALPLLKRAAQLNPLWAEPIFRQAQLSSDPAQKEDLLKRATQLAPRETEYWMELARVQTVRGEATAAQGTWLEAENSCATQAERDHVHQLAADAEQQRLDAADETLRREREAVHLDDERAQQAEAARIRAAEEKANRANDEAAGDEKPETVVSWSDVVAHKKLEGNLTKIDCLGSSDRLLIKDKAGNTIPLLLTDAAQISLTCGDQKPVRRISLTYAAQQDDRFKTSGTVLAFKLQ